MKPTTKAGIVLGVLVVVWTFVMGVTGWYKDPSLLSLFYLVVLIEVGVLIWGLKMTAAEGRTYGGQIGAGTLIALIGAVIIFAGSYFFTEIAYPQYFEEVREVGRQQLLATGMPPADVEAQLDMAASMQTSFVSALMGAIMTIVTGVVASLIIALFYRKKPVPSAVEA
ncbi:DUF4199 domain-containing protein [bacterium]|nr:MAG: DUF4199 domain-containing protein [bacterium]